MSVHLTPTELASEMNMKRRDVLAKCIEMNVPILKGRIDKTLFESSLKVSDERQAGNRLIPPQTGDWLLGQPPNELHRPSKEEERWRQ